MCRSLADGLVAKPSGYQGSVTSTKLKVSGIDVFSAGDFSGGEGCEDIVMRDASRGIYKRVIVKQDRVVGAVLYGDTQDGNWYFDLLKRQEDVSQVRDALIFGQAFASGGGASANPNAAVAALSEDAEICGCNGVSKAKVVSCIDGGATTLDAIRATCKASASCGSCTGLVESLLAITLGDDYAGERAEKTLCKCTSFTHEDVRRLIVEKQLKAITEVMQELHWTTPDGCSSCRSEERRVGKECVSTSCALVTGVQTCALPICWMRSARPARRQQAAAPARDWLKACSPSLWAMIMPENGRKRRCASAPASRMRTCAA